jgi:hypothetical protein
MTREQIQAEADETVRVLCAPLNDALVRLDAAIDGQGERISLLGMLVNRLEAGRSVHRPINPSFLPPGAHQCPDCGHLTEPTEGATK